MSNEDQDLEEAKAAARAFTPDELKDGGWFAKVLRSSLESYVKRVDASYFQRKYPGLSAEAIVPRRIELASRYSALEGGASASAYTAALALTLGTGGTSSPLTLPGAVATFAVDLSATTWLQLRLAYDMAVLHGVKLDIDDPVDLIELIRVAFGIQAGDLASEAAAKLAPEATRQVVKMVARGPILHFLRALPVVGKYLLQRNLIKFAIPVVGVPLSVGMNYMVTRSIGQRARALFHDKASINAAALALLARLDRLPSLLMRVAWLLAQADSKITQNEVFLLRELISGLRQAGHPEEELHLFGNVLELDVRQLERDLLEAPAEDRAALYDAACQMAVVDHELHKREIVRLRSLAALCGVPFDEADLHRRLEAMSAPVL